MCGISGILSRTGSTAVALDEQRQRHRGPDDAGYYADPHGRARLWFRRLAIIDLSADGHQPMSNEDGTVWLIFNGEIYNYRPLRDELLKKGHVFRSRTDCEVLVHLWEEYGREMVQRLNGMFAFCIWDQRTGEAFLARDHAGIKPLYLADTPNGLALASEAKVLLGLPGLDRTVDPIALRQYLTFLWVPGQRSMWRGIRKLPAGGWLSWTPEGTASGLWWDWNQSEKDDRSPEEWSHGLQQTLLETVERQLMSDVPLGVMLSGGLDSSVIAGAMRQIHRTGPIHAYTARVSGSQDGFSDDFPYAREVAEKLKLDLHASDISPRIAELLPQLVWNCDEPLADPAIAASYLLCQAARQAGTVVLLSGQGADELYHGYRSHRAVDLAGRMSAIPGPLVRASSNLAESLAGRLGLASRATPRRLIRMLRFASEPMRQRVLQLADWSSTATRDEILSPAIRQATYGEVYRDYFALYESSRARTDIERWSYVLFKTFLPALNLTYGDRTSMAVSLELRVPFLDRALVEQAGRMPVNVKIRQRRQKWVLGEAAGDWLPTRIKSRPKTGFGAPLREWLSGDLRPLMREMLLGERAMARGLFDRQGVTNLLGDLETGRRDVAYVAWALFTFELWARTFFDADGSQPISI